MSENPQAIVKKNGEEVKDEGMSFRVADIARPRVSLVKSIQSEGESLMAVILKSLVPGENAEEKSSKQGVNLGRKPHQFDRRLTGAIQTQNVHHSTCIHTKVAATVGLGFLTDADKQKEKDRLDLTTSPKPVEDPFMPSNADVILDPLTSHTIQDVLNDVCEDYWQVGDGYMEVVRKGTDSAITGLHHIPSAEVFVFLENAQYDFHYEVVSTEATNTMSNARRFARFNDRKGLIERAGASTGVASFSLDGEKDSVSEIIHFRRPTSLSRWYGFPDWLAAITQIELVTCLHQHKYDFFLNRGVPEFMLFLLGQKLDDESWKVVEDAIKANIGIGNSHKSLALNLPDKEMKVELHKLAMEGTGEQSMAKDKESLALDIVSAHRVPPLLAGIIVPGKIGASNELPNALMSFQALVIGPAQRQFARTLANTLADPGSGLKLKPQDFTFKTILDELDLDKMDTQSRMKQTVTEANAEGRDMSEGLKD